MVAETVDDRHADLIFHALSDTTRRDIVRRTLSLGQSVSALAREYPMSVTAVQKHVAVLERAALVTKSRQGREQVVRGNVDMIRQAESLLECFVQEWRQRMDRLGDVLAPTNREQVVASSPDTPPTPLRKSTHQGDTT